MHQLPCSCYQRDFSFFRVGWEIISAKMKDDWSRPLLIGLPQIRTGPLDGRLMELERVDPHLGYEPQMTGAS